eukprot:173332_1
MSLFLSLLAILLHQSSASNIVRRLSESDDDWYCVTGPTGEWGNWHGQNAIKGNYQYGGKDNNNNDYWFISLEDGANCVVGAWKKLYIRQSTRDNRYEIATNTYENCYITRCEDDAKTPDTCESWSSENFESVSWVSENGLFIKKGKCPDIHTENYLTATGEFAMSGCKGEFTKHPSRNNVYIRNEPYVYPWDSRTEYQYAWYFNYPSQQWECGSGRNMDLLAPEYTTSRCHSVSSSGPHPSATLSFHD